MDARTHDHPLLDEANAAFIRRRVSINVAARNAHNRPAVARSCGCSVSPDRRRVTVFLSVASAEKVLENLRDTGAIAVVFSQPSTHRTLQLKGTDARVAPALEADRETIEAYGASFVEELTGLGYDERFARLVVPPPDDRLMAVSFTPVAAFDQTPGRNAGKPLP